ncbi:fumarylacetoacetate hydrolase family protein [Mycolicibacter longobardus]|uniref:Ureidoglycolate lyase n=1 Tax=Mycolicibacter longobardus TaxID=1108812 RepID=A0A1X1YRM4_9MYCO|nr:fumarylacetoacetate hydrolase family protein [Mycolicibacter longobardus]MCV7383447.1 fumarylacetoacetate hydrolase family protein [Mycolicibacter longobardus]ORW13769.1 ureidoglycolate lyase [Mycolicibacter longobardus]
MKLVRVGEPGAEKPAVAVSEEHYVDVSDRITDYDSAFFASDGHRELGALVRQRIDSGAVEPLAGRRLGPPIARPHQILCIGMNYAEHALESGAAVAAEPVIFNKAPNCISGPHDDIIRPRGSEKLDYEVELGVVIGTRARYLSDDEAAAAAIGGYLAVNDVSERAFQLERCGQWVKGKSCESFNPCGPYLVTPDEIGDPQDLQLWLTVNGEKRQASSTRHMVFGVVEIIRYLSHFMVLEPGDLINTGTPSGVALGCEERGYLRDGDVVELGITGLGTQRNQVVERKE